MLTTGNSKANYYGKIKSETGVPNNFTPDGAGRNGAFREAKRASGIPVSQQPKVVKEARNKAGKIIPGKEYVFERPNSKRGNVVVREHFGHYYPDNPAQNRGNHFNDIHGNHYDY